MHTPIDAIISEEVIRVLSRMRDAGGPADMACAISEVAASVRTGMHLHASPAWLDDDADELAAAMCRRIAGLMCSHVSEMRGHVDEAIRLAISMTTDDMTRDGFDPQAAHAAMRRHSMATTDMHARIRASSALSGYSPLLAASMATHVLAEMASYALVLTLLARDEAVNATAPSPDTVRHMEALACGLLANISPETIGAGDLAQLSASGRGDQRAVAPAARMLFDAVDASAHVHSLATPAGTTFLCALAASRVLAVSPEIGLRLRVRLLSLAKMSKDALAPEPSSS